MDITRTRSLTIRMGDYESFKTEATVTHSFPDDVDMDAVNDTVNGLLDTLMADDIADAKDLTGDRKSFIHRIPTEKD